MVGPIAANTIVDVADIHEIAVRFVWVRNNTRTAAGKGIRAPRHRLDYTPFAKVHDAHAGKVRKATNIKLIVAQNIVGIVARAEQVQIATMVDRGTGVKSEHAVFVVKQVTVYPLVNKQHVIAGIWNGRP